MLKGKITQEEIDILKKNYQPIFKYSTFDQKHDFVVAPITKDIYNKITHQLQNQIQSGQIKTDLEVREATNRALFDRCLLWPSLTLEEKFSLPEGIIPTAAKTILEISHFQSVGISGEIYGPTANLKKIQDYAYWDIPTEEEINTLKSTYSLLYQIKVSGWIFMMRPMTRRDMTNLSTSMDPELALVKELIVWPIEIDWDDMPGGLIDCLNQQATLISGWDLDNVQVEEL